MQTKNNFSEETRFWMLEDNQWECWGCGQNHADCLHHIEGRGREEGCERSIYNAAPLGNHQCHLPRHGHWMTADGRAYLRNKTRARLEALGYQPTSLDKQYLLKYKYD